MRSYTKHDLGGDQQKKRNRQRYNYYDEYEQLDVGEIGRTLKK